MRKDEKRLMEDIILFNKGMNFHSYKKMGAHVIKQDQILGVCFMVWAPNAVSVSVVGDFNGWLGAGHTMEPIGTSGIWRLFVRGIGEGELYKYEIETLGGERILKADPFAFWMEKRPQTASVVYSLEGYNWHDQNWCSERKNQGLRKEPFLIYEVHLGSWKRKQDGSFLSYRELADELVPYVKSMDFTHIELLPVMEHPLDGSWGYQVTNYYAATSRFGAPKDLMHLIDRCHQAGLGVILDWVPGHFCRDAHGLACFDGTNLFEDEEHAEWGTYKFDFSKKEVVSFLISNALFWLEYYHADGLRVDGVTSILLLNYGKKEPDHRTDPQGGYENRSAAEFLRALNQMVFKDYPYALMIAEESTDWPLVTRPPYDGGLGFNYKWNMGWMNDTLQYVHLPFEKRTSAHHLITFSLMYAFSENFILPLSHDEVVHGKLSLLNRMPGDYWQKFAGLRLLYLYWLCHPGKKLIFMGGEFAQFIEWRDDRELDWFLLDYPAHEKHRQFVRAANRLYLEEESLWQADTDSAGFEWIDADNREQSVFSFIRKNTQGKGILVAIFNFKTAVYENFRIGVPEPGTYQVIFNSDQLDYGGSGCYSGAKQRSLAVPWHGQAQSICCTVPPLGGILLKLWPVQEESLHRLREETLHVSKQRSISEPL